MTRGEALRPSEATSARNTTPAGKICLTSIVLPNDIQEQKRDHEDTGLSRLLPLRLIDGARRTPPARRPYPHGSGSRLGLSRHGNTIKSGRPPDKKAASSGAAAQGWNDGAARPRL